MMKASDFTEEQARSLSADYQFEHKVDGFRCLYSAGQMLSERDISQNHKFGQIVSALKGRNVVLDGEVAIPSGTIHDINKSENWSKAVYYVFDILSFNGQDTRDEPLVSRQEVLRIFVEAVGSPCLQMVKVYGSFDEGWKEVLEQNLEGLIAKHRQSRYAKSENLLDENRSKMWLKIKHKSEREFVMSKWEEHQDGTGITFTDGFHRFSCRGENSEVAKRLLAEDGKVRVEVQYLYETKDGHLFQPVVKRVGKIEG